jgi:uncharacterized protein YndB with AHSA1/START domain
MDWRAEDEADFVEEGGRRVMRFVRHIGRPVEKVWAALTIPERIADWLAPAEVELRLGGRYHVTWPGSPEPGWRHVIRRLEPPRLLEIGSPEAPATRFELFAEGPGCRVVMTDFFPLDHANAAEVLAGWHLLMDGLDAASGGREAVRHGHRDPAAMVLEAHYLNRLAVGQASAASTPPKRA